MENAAMAESSDLGLSWLARQVSTDAFFIGSAFTEYRAMHSINSEMLAEMLGCTTEALTRLSLCRRPDDQAGNFREDVRRVAAFASCNAIRLLQVLREVASVASLREERNNASWHGLLMAARDRKASGLPHSRTPPRKTPSKREPKE